MFEEKRREERFCEDVGCHVRSGYPGSLKRTIKDMISDKVIVDIYAL